MGGKPTWGRSCPKRVSVTNTPNELLRRYVLRWQTETSGDTFSHFGQHVLGVSLKNRFRRHLANHCRVKCHSLAPNISPLLPESAGQPCQQARQWPETRTVTSGDAPLATWSTLRTVHGMHRVKPVWRSMPLWRLSTTSSPISRAWGSGAPRTWAARGRAAAAARWPLPPPCFPLQAPPSRARMQETCGAGVALAPCCGDVEEVVLQIWAICCRLHRLEVPVVEARRITSALDHRVVSSPRPVPPARGGAWPSIVEGRAPPVPVRTLLVGVAHSQHRRLVEATPGELEADGQPRG